MNLSVSPTLYFLQLVRLTIKWSLLAPIISTSGIKRGESIGVHILPSDCKNASNHFTAIFKSDTFTECIKTACSDRFAGFALNFDKLCFKGKAICIQPFDGLTAFGIVAEDETFAETKLGNGLRGYDFPPAL